MNAQKFKNIAKALARVMTNTKDIEVTISGSSAYRMPGLINLPKGDFSDKDWCAMTQGWIDHELGHEKHTEHDCFVWAAGHSPLMKHLLNIIEDVRMEKLVGEEFPGAKVNLEVLAGLAITKGLFPEPTDEFEPLRAMQSLCLFAGRYHVINQAVLKEHADKAKAICYTHFGTEITDKVFDLVLQTKNATSTEDALEIAKSIYDLIKEESESNDEDDTDDGNSEDKDSNEEQQSPEDSQSSENEDESDDSSTKEEQSEEREEDEGDETKNSNQSTSESVKEALNELLEATVEEGLRDFHEALADQITCEAVEQQHNDPELLMETFMRDACVEEGCIDEMMAKRLSNRVYTTLQKVIFDQQQTLTTYQDKGRRVASKRLAGIPTGRFSVFKHQTEQREISCAVSILVDASGSMGVERMEMANTCALALGKGLQRNNIAYECLYYGVYDKAETRYALHEATSFSDKQLSVEKFKVESDGCTPTGEAMRSALETLCLRDETVKIMFVLTDGSPDYVNTVRSSYELCKAFDVKVVPIGINSLHINGFEKDQFVTIRQADELIDALKSAVKKKLLN